MYKAVGFEEGENFLRQGLHVGFEVSGEFTAQLRHIPAVVDKLRMLLEPHVLFLKPTGLPCDVSETHLQSTWQGASPSRNKIIFVEGTHLVN